MKMKESKKFLLMLAAFLACFYLPVELLPLRNPVFESLALVRWYAREHVFLCLIPAFFIAGAISVFVSQTSVIKYFGSKANKILAYSVASVSGTILAVCSCT
ncbi:MAG: permease, partial [Candidatus Omnitrophota bacterium]